MRQAHASGFPMQRRWGTGTLGLGARDIAADESGDGPHQHRYGDDDRGENDYALQYRCVEPDMVIAIFAVIVVFAHYSRLNPSAGGVVAKFAAFGQPPLRALTTCYAALFFNFSA